MPEISGPSVTVFRPIITALTDLGLEWRALLDSLRRDLCLQHLKDAHNPLAEIAFLAGFSGASAFNRAVRRWTGHTPLGYRRSLAGGS